MWDVNICRICVKKNQNCRPLNIIEKNGNLSIFDKIKLCVPDMKLMDPFKLRICPYCHTLLIASYNFRNLCLSSENKIKKLSAEHRESVGQYESTAKLLQSLENQKKTSSVPKPNDQVAEGRITQNTVIASNQDISNEASAQEIDPKLKKQHLGNYEVIKTVKLLNTELKDDIISTRFKLTVSESAAETATKPTANKSKIICVMKNTLPEVNDKPSAAPTNLTHDHLNGPKHTVSNTSVTSTSSTFQPHAENIKLVETSNSVSNEETKDADINDDLNLVTVKIENELDETPILLHKEEEIDSTLKLENNDSSFTASSEQLCVNGMLSEEFECKEEEDEKESGRESPLLEVLAEDIYDVPRNKEEELRIELRQIINNNPHLHKYHPQMFECKVAIERLPELKASDGESKELLLCKCNHCGMTFNSTTTLLVHVKLHFLEKPVKCNICKMAFTDRYLFNKHVEQHLNDKKVTEHSNIPSSLPKKTSKSPFTVNIKENSSFADITTVCIKELYCQICDLKLANGDEATEHWKKHCSLCLAFVKDILVHSKIHMVENSNLESQINFNRIEEYCLKKFHCQFCSANLSSLDSATTHMIQHCKICYKFVTSNISIHTSCHKTAINLKGDSTYLCLICKGFFYASHFEMHIAKPIVNPAAELCLNSKSKKNRKFDSDVSNNDGIENGERSDSSRSSSATIEERPQEIRTSSESKLNVIKEEKEMDQIVANVPKKSSKQASLKLSPIQFKIEKDVVEILSAVYFSNKEINLFQIKRAGLKDFNCGICCIPLSKVEANSHFTHHCYICLTLVNGSMEDHVKLHKEIIVDSTRMYMCTTCDRYASLDHFIIHHKTKFFECKNCEKVFFKQDQYIYHQWIKHNIFECEHCGTIKEHLNNLRYHFSSNHQYMLKENAYCQECSKDLKYNSLLKFHMWESHYEVRKYEDYFKKLEEEFENEMKTIHNFKTKLVICQRLPEASTSKKRKQDFSDNNKPVKVQKIKCPNKSQTFESIHRDCLNNKSCIACSILFDTTAAVEEHLRSHCPICFEITSDTNHYKIHKVIKHGDVEVFFCKQQSCHQYFQKNHFITHFKPRTSRTVCPLCVMGRFTSFNEFCMHMLKKHSLYACEFCIQVFNKFSSLAAHLSLEHPTFEKLSKCYICKQHSNFSNTHLLHICEEHMSCKKCNVYFISVDEQMSHRTACSVNENNFALKSLAPAVINGAIRLQEELWNVKNSPFEIYSSTCYTALYCKVCDLTFKNVALVEQHLKYHCIICLEKPNSLKDHFDLHKAIQTPDGQHYFYCLICKSYCDRNHFIYHQKENISYTTCYVSNCKKYFDKKLSLMLHAFNEHKTIICEYCEKYCYTLSGLHSHCLSKHKMDSPAIFCSYCKKSYLCNSTYKFHLWKDHTYCKVCDLSFETFERYETHQCFRLCPQSPSTSETHPKNDTTICTECNEVFESKEICVLHVYNDHKLYLCDVCGKHCNCLAGINGHYINKHRSLISSYDCKICSKTFSYAYIYKFHLWKEHTRCSACDVSFKSIQDLNTHECTGYSYKETIESEDFMGEPSINEQPTTSLSAIDWSASCQNVMNGDKNETLELNEQSGTNFMSYEDIKESFVKNLFCKFCNVRFQNELAIKNHMEFHCPVCFKLCKDVDSHFKRHRTVTKLDGHNLFYCFLCRVFHTKEHFLVHYKKQFLQCNECDKICVTQDDYTLHLFSVHQLYFCESCGKQFTSIANLIAHCRQFHRDLIANDKHCKYCSEKILFTITEKLHVWKEHLTCKMCKLTFQNHELFEKHVCVKIEPAIKKVAENSAVTCDKCLGTFENAAFFAAHNCQIDSVNTLYKCEICKSSFSRLAFNKHMKDHITH